MRYLKHFTWLAMVLALLLSAAPMNPVQAAESANQAPTVAPDWWYESVVTPAWVKQNMQIPRDDEKFMILDARPYETKFVKGYIPTAYSLPNSKFAELAPSVLPKNKDATLVFYCGGYHCKLSHKSAAKAKAMGYTDVHVMAAGMPAWKAAGYGYYEAVPIEYIENLLVSGEPYMLIDARPANKFLEGAVPSSVSIPDTHFDKYVGMLPTDKGTELVFYCGGFHCKLSHKSAIKAQKLGYTKVSVYEAGYPDWKQAHGAGSAVATEIQAGGVEGSMDVAQFEEIVKTKPGSITLIDVRDPDEYKAGHLPSARNIPVDQLEEKLSELPTNKPIVYVCASGARSGEAFYMTLDKLPEAKDVYYLEAVIHYNEDGSFDITPNK